MKNSDHIRLFVSYLYNINRNLCNKSTSLCGLLEHHCIYTY